MNLLNLGCGTRYHSDWINVDMNSTGQGVIPCNLRWGLPFRDRSFDAVYHSHVLEHFSKTLAPVFLGECLRVLKKGGIIRVVVPDLEQTVRTYLKILEEVKEGINETKERYNWILLELLDQMVRNQSGGEMLKYWRQDPLPAAEFVFKRMGSELLDNLSSYRKFEKSTQHSRVPSAHEADLDALKVGQFRLSGEVHQWMYDQYSLRALLQEAGFQDIRVCSANESSISNFNSYLLDIEEDGSAFRPISLYVEASKPSKQRVHFRNNESSGAAGLTTEIGRREELSEVLPKSTQSLLHVIRQRETQIIELRQDRDTAVEEINQRDAQLAELSRERNRAVEEIHKRDAQLAELGQDRDLAVEEIHKRDAQLAELSRERNRAVEEIHKRDAQLAELSRERNRAVEEIHKRDAQLVELGQERDLALQQIVERDSQLAQMKRKMPLVSVVTPTLNCEKWVETCINSVLTQDYPNIEHIIVDGGSTDGTLEICRRHPHLITHSGKDRGQSHAINKGFAMAQGDILAWLCADDEYEPGAVSAAVKGIMSGQNVVMGFSRFTDAESQVIADHPANPHLYYNHDMFIRFWKYSTISQPATFWTRNMWETCGPVKENFYYAMDYDLWLRMSQKCHFHRVDAYTAKYRIHPEAKCFADNYGPRVELIEVSRRYWPPKWKLGYWKLYVSYILSRGAITQHYMDGEELLKASAEHLDNSKRLRAILLFAKAHYKHLATPFLPSYKLTLKRILKEGIGPAWFWVFAKRLWYAVRRTNR